MHYPAENREKFYREFEQQALRPTEDPSLCLWHLKDLLRRAWPDLSGDAFDALLRRQCIKRHSPFDLNYWNLTQPRYWIRWCHSPSGFAQSMTCLFTHLPLVPLYSKMYQILQPFQNPKTSKMVDQQANLVASVSSLTLNAATPVPPNNVSYHKKNGVRCFFYHEEGHVVRQCKKRQGASHCTASGGWCHNAQNCSTLFCTDSYQLSPQGRKSLNYQRVPCLERCAPFCYFCWCCP